MPREGAEQKDRRYLSEGRVIVERLGPEGIRATVRGNGDLYAVTYQRGGWHCTCPALGRCSHLVALMLIAVRPGAREDLP